MIYTNPHSENYYTELAELINNIGYNVVEYKIYKKNIDWNVKLVLHKKAGVSLDDCTKVHRIVRSRLETLLNTRDLSIQVMSPGLNRVIKDGYEFSSYIGETIKVWVLEISNWVEGKLLFSDENKIQLSVKGEEKFFNLDDIKKAKLVNS